MNFSVCLVSIIGEHQWTTENREELKDRFLKSFRGPRLGIND
jgi:hypothetical protein